MCLFLEKADFVSACVCVSYFATACWHDVCENLPFSCFCEAASSLTKVVLWYLYSVPGWGSYWCAWQLWVALVTGHIPIMSRHAYGLDILYVCMLFLSALFVVKLCGCRKSLCFLPALLKTLVMRGIHTRLELLHVVDLTVVWFYRLRPSSTDTIRKSGGKGIFFPE